MQEEWTWIISSNYIIKSDVYIKLKYIQISLDICQQISYHAESKTNKKKTNKQKNKKKKDEINISAMKTNQMPNMW